MRTKIKIVGKKIRKYGAIGKIPMGASMRIYHQNQDSESSISSSASEEPSDDGTNSDGSQNKVAKKKPKVNRELLNTTELVYQPEFKKVVTISSQNVGRKIMDDHDISPSASLNIQSDLSG